MNDSMREKMSSGINGSKKFDIIVIGSGISGMVSALKGARSGKSVVLLEAAREFGGYMNPFRRKGFEFSPGLHYIGSCGEDGNFRKFLDELGLSEIEFAEMNPAGFDRFQFPGYRLDFPKGLDNLKDILLRDFPEEKIGIIKFFKLLDKVYYILVNAKNARGVKSIWDVVRRAVFLFPWLNVPFVTVLDKHFKDPLLRAVISAQCGNAGLPPSQLSAVMYMVIMCHYSTGGYVPIGGTGRMRDIILREFHNEGGVSLSQQVVNRVDVKDGYIQGVETEKGEYFQGKTVISSINPTALYRLVDQKNLPEKIKVKVDNTKTSLGSFMLFWGVKDSVDLSRVEDKNIWHYDNIDIEKIYNKTFRSESLPEPDNFFLHSPTQKDTSGMLTSKGGQIVELVSMANAEMFKKYFNEKTGKRSDEYRQLKEQLAENFINSVERYIPNLRDNIIVQSISTPATNNSYIFALDGEIYGPSQTPDQSLLKRFMIRSPIKNLFLSGAGTISCGVVPCAMSGMISGTLAVKTLDKMQ